MEENIAVEMIESGKGVVRKNTKSNNVVKVLI
jgi:hypothetical protein